MTATITQPDDTLYEDFLRTVREWCENEVAPRAREIDDTSAFFPDLMRQGAELGLHGLIFDDGGAVDLTYLDLADETTQLVASYSGAVALGLAIGRLHSYLLARYAEPAVASAWFPLLQAGEAFGAFAISEPDAGTDVRGITTMAVPDGDGFRINGEKAWVTQGPAASFAVVLTKLGSRERRADTAAFVVPFDAPGVTVGKDEPMVGFRGMPMANLALNDVWLPADHRLRVDGFRGMMDGVNLSRIDAAGYAVGFLRGCLREAGTYASQRRAFGSAIGDLQAVQLKLGSMSTDHAAARALLQQAVRSFQAGDGGDPILLAQAKLFASDAAMRHTVEAVQVFGGYGMHHEYPVQRMMRDAKITQIFDGTSEILALMVGRAAVRDAASY
jgi:alkylation response protein AidB-like acyl-CoA dehydrogenase